MRELPLRSLLTVRPGDRIVFHNLWPRRHGNARYRALLPRLERVDAYLIRISERRLVAAAQFRVLYPTRRLREELFLRAAARRYRWCLTTTDLERSGSFPGEGVVADVDDPRFTPREVAALNRPSLRAYVVTVEDTARRFEELGVEKPWHVIPQGADLSSLRADDVARIRAERRRDGDFVAGFVGSWLLSRSDRGGGNPLWNVDHLLDVWDEIHARVPNARLWLIGTPSAAIERRCRGRDDVVLFGRVPQDAVLAHVACFDVALYARERDIGMSAMKIAEYIGAGVPTVSYDYRVAHLVGETGAGVLAGTPRELAEHVARLAADPALREQYAAAARQAAPDFDWARLARRYETEILDRYLV